MGEAGFDRDFREHVFADAPLHEKRIEPESFTAHQPIAFLRRESGERCVRGAGVMWRPIDVLGLKSTGLNYSRSILS